MIEASRPLQIASVADRAYLSLRERILAGDLPPDARLHQEDLSRELGVSRTPVREALGRLAAEGLVELLPNRGARVAEVGLADMEAAYQARLIVEPPAAALAAQNATGEDVAAMREAIAAHRAHVGEVTAAFTANRAFHLALIAASGNLHLTRFAESLWAGRVGMRVYELQSDSAFIAVDADQHEAIADAVEAGDAALAERLVRQHIGGAMATFVTHLGAVERDADLGAGALHLPLGLLLGDGQRDVQGLGGDRRLLAHRLQLTVELDDRVLQAPDPLDLHRHRVAHLHGPRVRGRAGEQDVAGLERDQPADVRDLVGEGEHQVAAGVALLRELAVDVGAQDEVLGVDVGGVHQRRPQRAEAVLALDAEHRSPVGVPEVVDAPVVGDRVAAHVAQGVLHGWPEQRSPMTTATSPS